MLEGDRWVKLYKAYIICEDLLKIPRYKDPGFFYWLGYSRIHKN